MVVTVVLPRAPVPTPSGLAAASTAVATARHRVVPNHHVVSTATRLPRDSEDGGVVSLPGLQNHIKRDPPAYESEFQLQWEHFEATLAELRIAPQRPHQRLGQMVMFLAHTAPCYQGRSQQFGERLVGLLKEEEIMQQMHCSTRHSLVDGLILLRNKRQLKPQTLFPLWFDLMTLNDRPLRQKLVTHIVRDLVRTHKTNKDQKFQASIQRLFFDRLLGNGRRARKAAVIIIEMYRRRVWIDRKTVNAIAAACLSPDQKVALAAARFLMGQDTKGALEDEGLSSGDEATQLAMKTLDTSTKGAKKSKTRVKKLEKAKTASKRLLERREKRKGGLEALVNFAAIDLLYDPQGLAENLLQRVKNSKLPYKFRLTLLQLLSRLIGRHQLQLLNFYVEIDRYLDPRVGDVTKVLATLAQACHELVPPDELQPAVRRIIERFVVEHQEPEVIAVGLNAIREIACRAPLALSQEMLEDLCSFRSYRNKGVVSAARSLINLYRDIYPSLLEKKLRGKDAAMAVAASQDHKVQFGGRKVVSGVEGADLLLQYKKKRALREAEESDNDADDEGEGSDGEEHKMEREADSDDDLEMDSSEEIVLCEGDENEEEEDSDEENDEDDNDDAGEDEEKEQAAIVLQRLANKKRKGETAEVSEDSRPLRRRKVQHDDNEEVAEANDNEDMADVCLEPTAPPSQAESKAPVDQVELLGPEDFNIMKKLNLAKLMRQPTRKNRQQEGLDFDAIESDLGEQCSGDEEDSDGAEERMDDEVTPGDLTVGVKKKMNRDQKIARAQSGKEDKAAFKPHGRRIDKQNNGPSVSIPNVVKARNKPLMMVKRKRIVREKAKQDVSTKVKNLRKHIKTLKMKTGGKKKFRRM